MGLALVGIVGLILSGCRDEIEQVEPQQSVAASEEPEPEPESEPAEEQSVSEAQAQVEASEEVQAEQAAEAQQAEPDEAAAQPQEQEREERAVSLPPPIKTFLPREAMETAEGIAIIRDSETPQYFGLDWSTDWGIRLVELDELSQGAGRDAIPAISGPLYWTLEEASEVYTDNVPLVQVSVNGDVRGFPLEILTWHEIVNDTIGGVPVAVTFCPLCNTAIAFESQIGEEVYKFGVSGLLRNSDLVMYDRKTESLWQQSSGRAIVGAMVGGAAQVRGGVGGDGRPVAGRLSGCVGDVARYRLGSSLWAESVSGLRQSRRGRPLHVFLRPRIDRSALAASGARGEHRGAVGRGDCLRLVGAGG